LALEGEFMLLSSRAAARDRYRPTRGGLESERDGLDAGVTRVEWNSTTAPCREPTRVPSTRFQIPSASTLDAHERTLVRTLGLSPASADSDEDEGVLLDSFDGRLVRDGGIAVRRDAPDGARLQWTDLDRAEDRGLLRVAPADTIGPADLPRGPVAARLVGILDVRSLVALARVRERRRRWEKRDRRGKVVLRLHVVDSTTVMAEGSQTSASLPPHLHLIGLKGFDRDYAAARTRIDALEDTQPAATPWAIEVLRAAGLEPGRDPARVELHLRAGTPVPDALREIFGAYLGVIRAHREGTRRALDPEFLHDFRVAVRRTRALLRGTKAALPPSLYERFREEFRWLARQTSRARDLDVYLLDFDDFTGRLPRPDRPALEPVRVWLQRETEREHERLADVLAGERVDTILDDWAAAIRSDAFGAGSSTRDPTAGSLAARVVARAHRRVLRDGRTITADSPDEALHDLRKRAKALRYLVDGFRGAFDRKTVKKQIRHLKDLQDNLGRHQDRAVQVETLRRIAHELDGTPPATFMALGYLVEQLDRDRHALRDEFAAHFEAYDAPQRRRTFERMLDAARRAEPASPRGEARA